MRGWKGREGENRGGGSLSSVGVGSPLHFHFLSLVDFDVDVVVVRGRVAGDRSQGHFLLPLSLSLSLLTHIRCRRRSRLAVVSHKKRGGEGRRARKKGGREGRNFLWFVRTYLMTKEEVGGQLLDSPTGEESRTLCSTAILSTLS